jgi:hypothetical protein
VDSGGPKILPLFRPAPPRAPRGRKLSRHIMYPAPPPPKRDFAGTLRVRGISDGATPQNGSRVVISAWTDRCGAFGGVTE